MVNESFLKFPLWKLNQILSYVQEGLSQKQIQSNLGITKGTASKWFKSLQGEGYITALSHTKPRFWRLTDQGQNTIIEAKVSRLSVGASENKIRVHNFRLKFPLIKDTSQGFWENTNQMNNWIKSHKKLQHMGVTVEKTPQSIVVNFLPFEVRGRKELDAILICGVIAIIGFLSKEGIEIDPWGVKLSRQEYAVATPLVKPLTDRGITIREDLGRLQQRIFTNDEPKEAQAWIDASKGNPEIDTNDFQYAQDLLAMPKRVAQIEEIQRGSLPTMNAIANGQNYMAATVKILAEEMVKIRKKVKDLPQRRLGDFLRGAP